MGLQTLCPYLSDELANGAVHKHGHWAICLARISHEGLYITALWLISGRGVWAWETTEKGIGNRIGKEETGSWLDYSCGKDYNLYGVAREFIRYSVMAC